MTRSLVKKLLTIVEVLIKGDVKDNVTTVNACSYKLGGSGDNWELVDVCSYPFATYFSGIKGIS